MNEQETVQPGNERNDLQIVLDGLGRIEPPQGLEAYVLERIESTLAQQALAKSETLGHPQRALFWPLASAATLLLVSGAGLMITERHRTPTPRTLVADAAHPSHLSSSSPARMATRVPAQLQPANLDRERADRGRSRSPLPQPAVRRAADSAATKAQAQPVSFPAPPLPLTDQERLLLRLAERRNPRQLAVLASPAGPFQADEDQAELNDILNEVARTTPAPETQPASAPSANDQPASPTNLNLKGDTR